MQKLSKLYKIEPFYPLYNTVELTPTQYQMAKSSNSVSLYIGYAMAFCTEKQVEEAFNYVLDGQFVESVKSCERTNDETGRPFKMFFITLNGDHKGLDLLVERIKSEGHIKINYDGDWFWKVTINTPKVKAAFKPRIMEAGEIKENR